MGGGGDKGALMAGNLGLGQAMQTGAAVLAGLR